MIRIYVCCLLQDIAREKRVTLILGGMKRVIYVHFGSGMVGCNAFPLL